MLPKGAPGRKSFVALPTSKKQFWREEAKHLRKLFTYFLPMHLCLLFFIDYKVYGLEIMVIIIDIYFVWMNFYNYMTLNKITISIQAGSLLMFSMVALTHF